MNEIEKLKKELQDAQDAHLTSTSAEGELIAKLRSQIGTLETERDEAKAKIPELETKITKLEGDLDTIQSEKDLLKAEMQGDIDSAMADADIERKKVKKLDEEVE